MRLSWIPGKDFEILKVKKGDIIETINGEKITFLELKRKQWNGMYKGRTVNVPLYANRDGSKPYAVKVIGFDESVVGPTIEAHKLSKGDLFALEGKKETYICKNVMGKNIHAICIATGGLWKIDASFTIIPIDIEKIKATL